MRSLGLLASLAVSSWLLRENLLAMIAGQMASLAEQIGGMMGITGTPPLPWVYALLFGTLALNSVMYLGLLHMLYSILLLPVAPPGFGTPPPFVRRALFGRNA